MGLSRPTRQAGRPAGAPWLPPRLALASLLLLLGQAGAASASPAANKAPKGLGPRGYHYQGDKLHLSLPTRAPGKYFLYIQSVAEDGAYGRISTRTVKLGRGDNRVTVAVDRAPIHRLRYRPEAAPRGARGRIWANRGGWFVGPGLETRLVRKPLGLGAALDLADDIVLARGFAASVLTAGRRGNLAVGRLLGFEHGFGVPVSRGTQALVIVARGSAGPIRLSVTQRLGPKSMQYWDYALVPSRRDFRRYVIPLARLRPRLRQTRPFDRIHGVMLRATHPSPQGAALEVDLLGLTERPGLRIARITRLSSLAEVSFEQPKGAIRRAELRVGNRMARAALVAQGTRRRIPLGDARPVGVTVPGGLRVWLCRWTGARKIPVCDPPDAPLSSYAVPPFPGAPLLVDAFDTMAAVNAYRQPITTFGSTHPVERDMRVSRTGSTLKVAFVPQSLSDYVGYFTPMPRGVDTSKYRTVELEIRGRVPGDSVVVGLRNAHDREARLRLRSYLPRLDAKRFSRVRLPLAAFAAELAEQGGGAPTLWPLRRLSVTMIGHVAGTRHDYELRSVRLTSDLSPIAIARFDGEPPRKTAVNGALDHRSSGRARIAVAYSATSKRGRGMQVSVWTAPAVPTRDEPAPTRPGRAAVLTFGLGRMDVRGYKRICFWLKAPAAGVATLRRIRLLLADQRRARSSVLLGRYLKPTTAWQRVCVPLAVFDWKVGRERLQMLSLIWDRVPVSRETIELDELHVLP